MKSALLFNWGCNMYYFFSLKTNWNDLNSDCLFDCLLVPLSSQINAEVLPLLEHMYICGPHCDLEYNYTMFTVRLHVVGSRTLPHSGQYEDNGEPTF